MCHGAQATRRQLERWVPRGTWADFTTTVVGFGQLIQVSDTRDTPCPRCTVLAALAALECTHQYSLHAHCCALRVHGMCTGCALLMQRGTAWGGELVECVERGFGAGSTQVCVRGMRVQYMHMPCVCARTVYAW